MSRMPHSRSRRQRDRADATARILPWLDTYAPALTFAVAIALRLAYALESHGAATADVLLLDAEYYDREAREILAGDWWGGREVFIMSPLYPYFLAVVYGATGGSLAAARLAQHVIGALTCALLARAGTILAGPVAGLIAGLLGATYGLLVFAESTLENEFLVLFLNTCALWLLMEDDERGSAVLREGEPRARFSTVRAAAAGVCLGLSVIVRPNAALLAVPVAIWFALQTRRRRGPGAMRGALQRGACVAAAMLLPVCATGLRNYAVSGQWVWVTGTGGEVFFIGTLPEGGGGYAVPSFVRPHPDTEHEDFRRRASEASGRQLSFAESSSYWYEEGWNRIRSAPADYLGLLGLKLKAFLNHDEAPDNYDFGLARRHSRLLALLWPGIGLVLPLAVLGLVAAARPLDRWVCRSAFSPPICSTSCSSIKATVSACLPSRACSSSQAPLSPGSRISMKRAGPERFLRQR